MNTDELTWTCHICGDERPDAKISVHKRDISPEHNLPEGTVQENVRYCNDRTVCVEGSQTYRHHKPEGTHNGLHGRLEGQGVDADSYCDEPAF